ncbi:septal ring lytic transglycosylase RlpA family protein [Cupriavidus respiraculi]|uniref:septal ring lytic transglycosylase RlpA family protein n=1 Tax=Cupriavidus respiraculi TaxID=195930 RepID=UPI001C94ECA8|nr:septal ring lytic transglycosylase RlpA family protein [Cupriavidus respiraculi]MBY4946582.1 septal ring lytic transglycosylase RlpA family protein [Cupriavidus respiraculi]
MHWLSKTSYRLRRMFRPGVHALCALALAACAMPPTAPDGEEGQAPTAATPATPAPKPSRSQDKLAKAPDSANATPPVGRSWNLFGWGGDDALNEGVGPKSSLEGLRPDLGSFEQRGVASWYGKAFHGRKTANGERFNMGAMTAAHPSLPLDSWVLVRNLRNDKVAVLRINDRGPYHGNRVLDVSYGAAKRLGFVDRGATQVEIRRLSRTEVAALGSQYLPEGAEGGGDDAPELSDADNAKPDRSTRKARKAVAKRKVSSKH